VTKSRNIRPRGRPWDPKEIELVRELYADMKTEKLAVLMGRTVCGVYQTAAKLGIRKSAAYLASPEACRLRRDDSPASIATRFVKGQVPANKGLRRPGWAPGRMASTQFKKGGRTGAAARNWCPVGSIRTDPEGFLRIKVREWTEGEACGFGNTKIWPLLNRHVWEQHKGPIPPSHAVVFKDRNRANVDIDNLECISRADLCRRNSSHRWGKEVFEVIQLRGALNRKLRTLSEKQNIGLTQPSL
jgi:hypothetical protein